MQHWIIIPEKKHSGNIILFVLVALFITPESFTQNRYLSQCFGTNKTIGSFVFDFFVLAGIDVIFAQDFEISFFDGTGLESFHTRLLSSNANPAIEGGAGIRFLLNDNAGIRAFVSYFCSGTSREIQADYDSRNTRDSFQY